MARIKPSPRVSLPKSGGAALIYWLVKYAERSRRKNEKGGEFMPHKSGRKGYKAKSGHKKKKKR